MLYTIIINGNDEKLKLWDREHFMDQDLFNRLFSLKRKTALITGSYRGIGLEIAETYAEAGADVALVARDLSKCQTAAQKIADKYGVRAIGKSMDVHDSMAVDAVVQEVVDEFGKIDILVNSAGISGSEKPVLEMTDEDLDDVMDVDFRGTFLVSRAVAKEMTKHQPGKIINVASLAGKIATPNMSGYCAGKAAVIHLTRVMALELMRYNIQVNVLCPGYFLTKFNRDFFESDIGKRAIKRNIPMNRVGRLEELQSTALYLATCPVFLTGAELYIDGGHGIV
ncbi:MAG: SDR family oxidoreductase [Syntrophobacterales bacterium]|nr:SDR family oxidoreductase [Syntrophobacterales bacterium]